MNKNSIKLVGIKDESRKDAELFYMHKVEGLKDILNRDFKCDCCEYVRFLPNDFEKIKKEQCYGKKSKYMIEKVVDEIVLAKARRESDGTYSA